MALPRARARPADVSGVPNWEAVHRATELPDSGSEEDERCHQPLAWLIRIEHVYLCTEIFTQYLHHIMSTKLSRTAFLSVHFHGFIVDSHQLYLGSFST